MTGDRRCRTCREVCTADVCPCCAAEARITARRTAERLADSGVPAAHRYRSAWGNLTISEPRGPYARTIARVREFVDRGNGTQVLFGPPGTGKTQALSVAVLSTIEAGRPARLIDPLSLLDECRAALAARDPKGWLARWSAYHVLALDEFTMAEQSDRFWPRFYWLLEKRHAAGSRTIIALNCARSDLIEALSPQLFDRARGSGGLIPFESWPSFRDEVQPPTEDAEPDADEAAPSDARQKGAAS
ncbi:IstB-like ATP binding protein [Phycisphaerae bacterium RAS1]|nr:IstB-like ATP binding protein [Phycisphaerae bacterium RAS1]